MLHPGETGVCSKHGTFDEYCGKCADERQRRKLQSGIRRAPSKHSRFRRVEAREVPEPEPASPPDEVKGYEPEDLELADEITTVAYIDSQFDVFAHRIGEWLVALKRISEAGNPVKTHIRIVEYEEDFLAELDVLHDDLVEALGRGEVPEPREEPESLLKDIAGAAAVDALLVACRGARQRGSAG